MPEADWSRISENKGYPIVYCPDHPNVYAHGCVFVHRYVYECYNGRFLESHEIVHHKDEIKHNFSIENLELTNKSDHAKHHKRDVVKAMVTLTCPNCFEEFTRARNKTHLVGKCYSQTFCSRRCIGQYGHRKRGV